MSISIDFPRSEIFIPKEDLSLVQMHPTEIRNLDINWFRMQLKNLEDTPEGMGYQKTHNHSGEVELGGLTYSRVVEILEPYTVTFENGQYAVNLQGANSNIGDRVNVNQVSVRSANSAGLITSAAIEYGEYGGGVTVDTGNRTGKASLGAIYPIGTLRKPCLSISDALIIAASRGFNKLFIIGEAVFTSEHNVDGFMIIGTSHIQNRVTLEDGASCVNSVFRELEIFGILDGNNEIDNCIVNSLTYFSGHIHQCGLKGEISLRGGAASVISDCKTIDPFSPPTIDMGGSGQDLAMPNYSGLLYINNLSGAQNFAGIGLLGGTVYLDTSVTAGTIQCAGVGNLLDASTGVPIQTGIWNGGVNIINQTVTEENIVERIWNAPIEEHLDPGSTGSKLNTASSGGVDYDTMKEAVWGANLVDYTAPGSAGDTLVNIETLTNRIRNIEEGNWRIVGTQMIFYDTSGIEMFRYNLFNQAGQPSNESVFRRDKV